MTTQNTLSSAATHVFAQYNDAGKTLVRAYRSGTQCLLGRVGARYGAAIGRHPVPLVDENIQAGLLGTHARRFETKQFCVGSFFTTLVPAMEGFCALLGIDVPIKQQREVGI